MSEPSIPFQPIPDACPIPRGIVSLIGGALDKHRPSFALWRDKEQIIIEAKGDDRLGEDLDPNDPCYQWWLDRALRKRYADYLEVIQGLIRYIDFKATNWGYLQKDRHGQYYIKQRQRTPLYRISSQPWTTYIPEREVEFTVWGSCSDRRGIWKGKKVDIMYAWNDIEMWAVDMAMTGARAAEGLDLTYEVYGHLVDDDGSIIGLVSEAATKGFRMIGQADKGLIYGAIAKLQSKGCLYKGCGTNRFLIQDGKVRLIELNCITPYSDRVKLEKDAEAWHWRELRELFNNLDESDPIVRLPPLRYTASWRRMDLIYPICSPELPIGGILLRRTFFSTYASKYWQSHREALLMMDSTEWEDSPDVDQNDTPSTIIASNEHTDDVPLSSRQISSMRTRRPHLAPPNYIDNCRHSLENFSQRPRPRLLLAGSNHPYARRAARPRPGKSLVPSSFDTHSFASTTEERSTDPERTVLAEYRVPAIIPDVYTSAAVMAQASSPGSYVDDFLQMADALFGAGQIYHVPDEDTPSRFIEIA